MCTGGNQGVRDYKVAVHMEYKSEVEYKVKVHMCCTCAREEARMMVC